MGTRLVGKLDHSLDEVLHYDFYIGLGGAAGSIYLAIQSAPTIRSLAPMLIGIVGVVIGAGIAGMAIVASFLDGVFIRKVHRIGKRTSRYVAPFAFTAALGVLAALALIVLQALPRATPEWIFVTISGLAGLFACWTIASVLPLLSLTMDFVELKSDAADVPDSVVAEDNIHQLPARPTGESHG